MKKLVFALTMTIFATALLFTGCKKQSKTDAITILAAASLMDCMDEIIGLYKAEHPVFVQASYGGSGALQAQIEEGVDCDIFISAAQKQMNALKSKNLMLEDSCINLLENKIVLIVPKNSALEISDFKDVAQAKIKMIGLGEPTSVPVGQYSQEVFTNLGMWDDVTKKANFGQDVRTVLAWVESGDVDCGVVYATDANSSAKVRIVSEAPEGSCKKVIYPAGIVKNSKNISAAKDFLLFLQTEKARNVFEKHGFSTVKESPLARSEAN